MWGRSVRPDLLKARAMGTGNMSRRVLFIVENNTVPTDIRVWREATTARSAGYAVTVIAPTSSKYTARHEIIDGIEIYRHPTIQARASALNQLAEYANAFLWEMALCLKLFATKRFDVIHAANPPDHVVFMAFILRIFGVKFIFDHHDLAPELYLAKFGGRKNLVFRALEVMERFSCSFADAIISTNQSYRAHVIEKYGVPGEKIFVVRNDPEIASIGAANSSHKLCIEDGVRLVYVGSINLQDGVDLLVKSLSILAFRRYEKKFHCTVVGDGDDLVRVKGLSAELGLDELIDFTGYVHDRGVVQDFIRKADICLETAPFSEANAKSTFIKVMEYMAAGKPTVAFDLKETRYSTQDSALLVEQGNVEALAGAILRLIRDPALRQDLGARARARIAKELNWGRSSVELLRAYEYVCPRPSGGVLGSRKGDGSEAKP